MNWGAFRRGRARTVVGRRDIGRRPGVKPTYAPVGQSQAASAASGRVAALTALL